MCLCPDDLPVHDGRMNAPWLPTEPTREHIDSRRGALLLEFGSPGCGHCRAAQPFVEQALREHAAREAVPHLRVIDGPGQPLGRSFGVKLWPTLVFLRDGHEVARLVRPRDAAGLKQALDVLSAAS
jgi:thioredoxin 1